MFWKRKKSSTEIFSLETEDRRLYYRVSPSAEAPVIFEFGGEKVKANDIGAGGLAFKNKHFKKGDTQAIELRLPEQDVSITTILTISEIDKQNICHCHFSETAAYGAEAIHQYVLKRQKEIIQSQKESNKQLLVLLP